MDDLLHRALALADRLPSGESDDPFRFDETSALALPEQAATDLLVGVLTGSSYHPYDFHVDRVALSAGRRAMRALGVLVVSTLFAPPDSVLELELTHPASVVKRLWLGAPGPQALAPGLMVAPISFTYAPERPERHPWSRLCVDAWDLPSVWLTTRDGMTLPAEMASRDTVALRGGQAGTARLAQLLLDAGDPDQPRDEFQLECEVGYRGVAPGSVELSLLLPGSFGFAPEFDPLVPGTSS